jgi:hypothetical protein
MIEKKASYSGEFRPVKKNGEWVNNRELIGKIFFAGERNQLANGAGLILWIQPRAQVTAGDVICEISETAAPPST